MRSDGYILQNLPGSLHLHGEFYGFVLERTILGEWKVGYRRKYSLFPYWLWKTILKDRKVALNSLYQWLIENDFKKELNSDEE